MTVKVWNRYGLINIWFPPVIQHRFQSGAVSMYNSNFAGAKFGCIIGNRGFSVPGTGIPKEILLICPEKSAAGNRSNGLPAEGCYSDGIEYGGKIRYTTENRTIYQADKRSAA